AERLRAFGEKRKPDFSFAGDKFASLVQDQRTIFEIQEDTKRNRRDVLLKQIDQRSSEVDLFEDQEVTMEKNIALLEEELNMRETLFKKGLSPKIVYLDIKRQVNQAQGDLATLEGEWQQATEALDEARSRLAEEDAKIREQALSEMGSVTREVAQVTETLNKLEDRVRRLDIKAPVRGIVMGLKANSVRGVLAPGAVIMEIVPMDKDLVVEAKITTNDVGHVRTGLPVKVKILTYNYARYGGITGVLKSVSATTFLDAKNKPYYKGTIVLDRNYVGFDPEKNRVLPGMTVQADIKTGKKTLLQYLLKPVYSSVDRSFRER
ncbi:MAG TPA: HlyD family type I secretion periplasmic adaptor subunit, partial [Rhodospirillales bacterium]|nr:HlyD family type I secretion periplasmic adaptor subunit [Rhodospirillales bacterium]